MEIIKKSWFEKFDVLVGINLFKEKDFRYSRKNFASSILDAGVKERIFTFQNVQLKNRTCAQDANGKVIILVRNK